MSTQRVIGKDNTLPWHISADLKRFKKLTSGHTIVMGRKTYDSIGKVLPHRTNHIISSQLYLHDIHGITQDSPAKVFASVDDWLDRYESHTDEHIYVIGGASIYRELLDYTDQIELTLIHDDTIQGDTFFPEFEDDFVVQSRESLQDADYRIEFLTYVRK